MLLFQLFTREICMTCYTGFGNLADGRPFWIGDFYGSGMSSILFYYPGDDNWWLGTINPSDPNRQLVWLLADNTAGFGHAINDGRPFWTGRFTRTDRDQILFYYPGDNNWWLGTHDDQDIKWEFVGNTGFGQINDGRPFWIGKFTASSFDEILFYS